MEYKLRFNFKILLLGAFVVFCSCSKDDKNISDSGNEMSKVSAKVIEPPVAAPIKPQIELNDYKGVTWGTSFESFKKIKNYEGDYGKKSNYLPSTDIALALGVPFYKRYDGAERLQSEYLPHKFNTVEIKADDVTYIFYDDKFAMAYSALNSNNENSYIQVLTDKYMKVDTINRTFTGVDCTDKITHHLFKASNARIYLMKMEPCVNFVSKSLGVLYIPDSFYKIINDEIEEARNKEERKKTREEKKNIDKLQ